MLYGRGVRLASAPRPARGKDSFSLSLQEWKEQERAFVDGVLEELADGMQKAAGSKENWRAFLDLYAQSPDYSAMNNLWARSQLRAKGNEEAGILLSESAWEKLGRRVKADYARPLKKRDRRFGYDNDREWDDSFAAEMMRPLGRSGFWRKLKDKNGAPIVDAEGKPRREWVPGSPDKGYATFVVYHEGATESLDGGDPRPLPGREEASGPDEAARNLIGDLRTQLLPSRGLEAAFDFEGPEHCRRRGQTVHINPKSSPADQASALLGEVLNDLSRARDGEDERRSKIHRAAHESSRYVIASLYGLDTSDQAIPHLHDISEESGDVRSLQSEVHHLTKSVMGTLDPRMREVARVSGKKISSRRAKRQTQKKA